jgi:hypothetical protein
MASELETFNTAKMPGLVRKVVILAAVEGLILQAHGAVEHHNSLKIDYQTRSISLLAAVEGVPKTGPRLEVHGIIGKELHLHTQLLSNRNAQDYCLSLRTPT